MLCTIALLLVFEHSSYVYSLYVEVYLWYYWLGEVGKLLERGFIASLRRWKARRIHVPSRRTRLVVAPRRLFIGRHGNSVGIPLLWRFEHNK